MARILIVDDSIVMRKNLRTILEKAGHRIVGEAVNGRQAITMYEELKPDVVTMDISMPIMKGVDAVKEIVTADPEAKIIMISALNQKQMVFSALKNGAKHYIIKPIEPTNVLSIIHEVLNEEHEEHVVVEDRPGFTIDNNAGVFVISINEFFSLKDIDKLDTALKGLMFITALKIRLELGTVREIPEDAEERLHLLIRKVKNVALEYRAQGGSDRLRELLS